MGHRHRTTLGGIVGAMALTLIWAAHARADMLYFKNGNSMWGEQVEEDGDEVTVTKGGETLRFPRSEVDRIEKKRTNMPDYKVDVPATSPAMPFPGAAPTGLPGGASPPAFNPAGPAGPQGALPNQGSGQPQGAIPIPGAAPTGPSQPTYGGRPGGVPPVPGPPAVGGPPPGATPR